MLDKAPAGGGAPFAPSAPQSPTLEPEVAPVDQGVGDQEIRVEDIPF